MAQKPTDLPQWGTAQTNDTEPVTQKASGWASNGDLISSFDNWFKRLSYQWLEWVSGVFGTPDADSLTISNGSSQTATLDSAGLDVDGLSCDDITVGVSAKVSDGTTDFFLANSSGVVVSEAGTSTTTNNQDFSNVADLIDGAGSTPALNNFTAAAAGGGIINGSKAAGVAFGTENYMGFDWTSLGTSAIPAGDSFELSVTWGICDTETSGGPFSSTNASADFNTAADLLGSLGIIFSNSPLSEVQLSAKGNGISEFYAEQTMISSGTTVLAAGGQGTLTDGGNLETNFPFPGVATYTVTGTAPASYTHAYLVLGLNNLNTALLPMAGALNLIPFGDNGASADPFSDVDITTTLTPQALVSPDLIAGKTDGTTDLGSTGRRFNQIFATDIDFSGDVNATNGTFSGTLAAGGNLSTTAGLSSATLNVSGASVLGGSLTVNSSIQADSLSIDSPGGVSATGGTSVFQDATITDDLLTDNDYVTGLYRLNRHTTPFLTCRLEAGSNGYSVDTSCTNYNVASVTYIYNAAVPANSNFIVIRPTTFATNRNATVQATLCKDVADATAMADMRETGFASNQQLMAGFATSGFSFGNIVNTFSSVDDAAPGAAGAVTIENGDIIIRLPSDATSPDDDTEIFVVAYAL